MNSQQRNWYLGALGVVRYIPRDSADVVDELPAPEQPGVEVAVKQSISGSVTLSPLSTTDPESTATAKPDELQRTKATAGPAISGKNAPTTDASDDTNDNKAVQFRLAFWQPSDQLTVLSSMPPRIRPSQAQHGMLANLLRAIHQLPGELPQVELLDWPLSPGGDSSLRGARELLSAFLDVKSQLRSFQYVLLMGEMVANLAQSDRLLPVGAKVPLSCNAQGIVTHSLYDMDRDTSLKKPTWEAIRFLSGGGD